MTSNAGLPDLVLMWWMSGKPAAKVGSTWPNTLADRQILKAIEKGNMTVA